MKGGNEEIEKILNDTNFIFREHYTFKSILGKGGFGIVVEAMTRSTLEKVAIKVEELL